MPFGVEHCGGVRKSNLLGFDQGFQSEIIKAMDGACDEFGFAQH